MFLKHYNNIDFLRVIFMLGIIIGHTNRVFFPNADFQFSLHNMREVINFNFQREQLCPYYQLI